MSDRIRRRVEDACPYARIPKASRTTADFDHATNIQSPHIQYRSLDRQMGVCGGAPAVGVAVQYNSYTACKEYYVTPYDIVDSMEKL